MFWCPRRSNGKTKFVLTRIELDTLTVHDSRENHKTNVEFDKLFKHLSPLTFGSAVILNIPKSTPSVGTNKESGSGEDSSLVDKKRSIGVDEIPIKLLSSGLDLNVIERRL